MIECESGAGTGCDLHIVERNRREIEGMMHDIVDFFWGPDLEERLRCLPYRVPAWVPIFEESNGKYTHHSLDHKPPCVMFGSYSVKERIVLHVQIMKQLYSTPLISC
jgi:hypothetical protein